MMDNTRTIPVGGQSQSTGREEEGLSTRRVYGHQWSVHWLFFGLCAKALVWGAPLVDAQPPAIHPEGTMVFFERGQTVGWQPERGEYFVSVRAGDDGARIDITGLGTGDPKNIQTFQPNEDGTGWGIDFGDSETRSLEVLDGSGRTLLARLDLAEIPLNERPPARRVVESDVGLNKCKAYLVDSYRITGFFAINATGTDFSFRTFDARLDEIAAGGERMHVVLDSQEYENNQVTVQACRSFARSPDGFMIEMSYPAEDPGTVDAGDADTPGTGASATLAGLALAFLLRRRGGSSGR